MTDHARDAEERVEVGTQDSSAEVVQGPATKAGYAEAIREAYRDTVEGIFRMGDLLLEAKDELAHGEFGPMVEGDLPFGRRTARRLMAVARDERLRDRSDVSDLPAAYSTLYRLTQLDKWQWAAIEPNLSADFKRSDIQIFLPDEPGSEQRKLVGTPGRTLEDRIDDALTSLPSEERENARNLLSQLDLRGNARARAAKMLAEASRRKRELWYELGSAEAPGLSEKASEQLTIAKSPSRHEAGIAEVARRERDALLEREELDLEGRHVEEAAPVLTLQSLLRWALTYTRRTDHRDVLSGLWAAREPEKIEEQARKVAEWMANVADRIENQGDGGPGV